MTSSVSCELSERPMMRGHLHAWAFFAAIPGGAVLILMANTAAARAAVSIYIGTVLLGFGTSAAYHRLAKTPRSRAIMQRLDHSMIYVLITGTYVPMCIVAFPRAWGISVLAAVSGGAALGIVLKMTAFDRAQWLSYALYPILGWVAVIALPVMLDTLSPVAFGLVFAGGIAYTIGFPVLLFKRPDPWPNVFGYHEVWHSFTVVAAVLHFGAVATLIR